MVLHTSGTTSRPKIVPLSQRNLCASAGNIRRTLAFTTHGPRPEHHAAVPHPRPDRRRAGAAVGRLAGVLHAGLQCAEVLRLDGRGHPTWYTAVPTMHQAILTRAPRNKEIIARNPLRFLRSSSSSMPPQVITELEAVSARR
jgi:acyl-CoA synthetase (AMP-forming)/AMP-acid ligase II